MQRFTTPQALLLVGAFGAPLVASEMTAGTPLGGQDERQIAGGVAIAAGLYWLATRSRTAAAVGIGAGVAWGAMKLGSGAPGLL